uniref:Uncharacterized protein n=1 Tax=Megaselia scalaris TaxID=36166 RepID=T1G9W6_MEGSC
MLLFFEIRALVSRGIDSWSMKCRLYSNKVFEDMTHRYKFADFEQTCDVDDERCLVYDVL